MSTPIPQWKHDDGGETTADPLGDGCRGLFLAERPQRPTSEEHPGKAANGLHSPSTPKVPRRRRRVHTGNGRRAARGRPVRARRGHRKGTLARNRGVTGADHPTRAMVVMNGANAEFRSRPQRKGPDISKNV